MLLGITGMADCRAGDGRGWCGESEGDPAARIAQIVDANRTMLLAITGIVMIVVLATVAAEVRGEAAARLGSPAL